MGLTISKETKVVLGGYESDMETLYKQIMPEGATVKEFGLFLAIAQSYNLNPYKREIYGIKYGNQKMQIVCGYETYIKRAERTGKLDGWHVEIDDNNESATITIHRKDWQHPFIWTVERAEFDKSDEAKSDKNAWVRMPKFMLKKVAIGQGFRLCFSDEMGGLPYLQEEINAGVIVEGEYAEESNDPALPYMARINEMDNIFELNNWVEKHTPDLKKLSKDDQEQLRQLLSKRRAELQKKQDEINALKNRQEEESIEDDTDPEFDLGDGEAEHNPPA